MAISGEDLHSAAWDRVTQQFSGCTDQGLLFAAENDMCLGLRVPESRFYGIGTVALQKCDHIFFADLAGIPVIVIKQFLRDAQIGGLIKQKWFAKLQAAYLGIHRKMFDDYYRDTCAISKADMIAFLQSNSAYSIKPALRDAQAKVHIVFGSKEQSLIRTSGKLLNHTILGSTMEVLPGYRHGDLSLNHPEQYARMIRELFL